MMNKTEREVVAYLRMLAKYMKQQNPFLSPDALSALNGAALAIRKGKHRPSPKRKRTK